MEALDTSVIPAGGHASSAGLLGVWRTTVDLESGYANQDQTVAFATCPAL